MNEKEFSKKVLLRLDSHFTIYEQVRGYHFTGKKFRIDAVICPKKTENWANPHIAFGIEFKSPDKIVGGNNVGQLIKQAYDYLNTDFENFGKIPILICPLKFQEHYSSFNEIRLIKRILGDFGIGEIVNDKNYKGLKIVFKETHDVWSERYGVEYGKQWHFKKFCNDEPHTRSIHNPPQTHHPQKA